MDDMDPTRKLTEINSRNAIYSVFFTSDGKQVLGGGDEGMIRRWQVDDGREANNSAIRAGSAIYAAALSTDQKRLVCGLSVQPRVRVWDADTHTKVLDIYDHAGTVQSVDISSDSTKFATCGADKCAYIWSLNTGKVLVGPVKHDSTLVAVRFSPDGARFATATAGKSIRIFHSDNGQRLLDIPCVFGQWISSPLAWSADGRHLFAVSASLNGVRCFDTSSGSLFSTWSVPGALDFPSITTSSNQKFVAVTASRSLSFWDVSTHAQVGPVIEHGDGVYFMKLSPGDDSIVTGEQSGKIIVRSLRDILPEPYFTGRVSGLNAELSIDKSQRALFSSCFLRIVQLPLLKASDATFEAWTKGDLTRAERILTEEILHIHDSSRHAQVLAHRSLVWSRLKQYNLAIDDAKRSVEIERSTVGHVAITMARAGNGEPDAAMRVFDLVIADGLLTASEGNLILLIKAIVLFECGRHEEAILRIEDIIDIVGDKTMYVAIRAQIYFLLGRMSLKGENYEHAAELLRRARGAAPPQECPELVVISLMFGWNFDGLALAIEEDLQYCMQALGDIGDVAMQRGNAEEAIARYSAALSLSPSNPAGLLFKRSRARAILELWEDALKDADEAIKADPQDPWGYERRHAALHALERHDEAVDTLKHMISFTKESPDSNTRCKCHCGGGDDALGHLIEEIMARSGEATVLSWTGVSSSYNSCLPASLAIHGRITDASFAVEEAEMDARISELRNSMSLTDAMLVYDRVVRLPPPRFANCRLYLPCVVFPVKKLVEKDAETGGGERCYRARVSGIGHVEFRTSDRFSLAEEPPRKLVLVHPWIRGLRGPLLDEVDLGSAASDSDDYCGKSESWSDSDAEVGGESSRSRSRSRAEPAPRGAVDSLWASPIATVDGDCGRALQLVVRLQQPFCALLLQQQMRGGYKRVAAEHEIVVQGLERRISSAKDIHIEVIEVV